MSVLTFAERFKNKSSTLSPTGLISINPDRAILKPADSQIHSPLPRSSYASIDHNPKLRSAKSFSRQTTQGMTYHYVHTEPLSVKPSLLPINADSPTYNKNCASIQSPKVFRKIETVMNKSCERKEFRHYGVKDYFQIRPKEYFRLGGLGPNVGNEEWMKKKVVFDRRGVYANSVKRGVKFGNLDGYRGKVERSPLRINRGE